jgi:glutamate synthase domain-containing protein 3
LVARHIALTGSVVGDRVLQAWPAMQHKLVAVMPREFKRIRAAAAPPAASSPTFGNLVGA